MSSPHPTPATILDHKLSFLSAQILALSAPMRIPSSYAQSQSKSRTRHSAAEEREREETALRQASIDAALLKLNARLRLHGKQVYGQVAKRHVAEQVEGLYWGGVDGGGDEDVEMGIEGEMKVLEKGADFASSSSISSLPTVWPNNSTSDSSAAEAYTASVVKLQTLNAQRTLLLAKLNSYRALKAALSPYDSPTNSVQENLIARGGEVEKEMERMRVLVGRVVGRIGGVNIAEGRREDEEGESDDDMMENLDKIMNN